MNFKKMLQISGILLSLLLLTACTSKNDSIPSTNEGSVTILLAAAASLEPSYTEKIIPMFEKKYPGIKVEGTYDSSGKLQTQIEEGLDADIFMSASPKQMNALIEKSLVDADRVIDLLENQIVMIVPKDSSFTGTSFQDIILAETIALGDPESVPAGQYAKEALTTLGIWEIAAARASFGTNVTEVLNWVAEGSSDAGIVYATDAATSDQVKVIAAAPEGSLFQTVLYPVAIVSGTSNQKEAQLFEDFLQTKEVLELFESYGFSAN